MSKSKQEKEINPNVSVYLFSKEKPKGEIFKFRGGKDSEVYKAMIENGHFDTPSKLDLPEKALELTTEQVQDMRPEDLKALLEGYGFIVMTPEQLKAEVNKMVDVHINIEDFTDEALIAEAERRGLKEGDTHLSHEEELDGTEGMINTTHIEAHLEQFNKEPKALTKDELVTLGNVMFKLSLRSNMKEDTLIAKITEALNPE